MDQAYSSAFPSDAEGAGHAEAERVKGTGWLIYAGVVLTVIGVMNTIYGIGAVSKSDYFTPRAHYAFGSLKSWGWIVLIIGVVQICAAVAIWRGARWGRWIGVTTASVNAVVQLLWMPSNPFGALALFSLDVLVLFALIAYGDVKTR